MSPGGALLLTAALAQGPPNGGQDPPLQLPIGGALVAPADCLWVEIVADQEHYFASQRIPVRLRFGLEQEFLASYLVPLFPRPLDLSLQVEAPGLEASQDRVPGASFVLGDELAYATPQPDESRDGRVFRVYELERDLAFEQPGSQAIASPRLHVAFATRFDSSFVQGRTPRDRHEISVGGAAPRLHIDPLPVSGQPARFGGAVGRFEVRAEASTDTVKVGESFQLTLTIEGEGNLASFPAPELPELEALHRFGTIERQLPGKRIITYDLAAQDDRVDAIPALAFAFLDPGPPPGYRTIETRPLPLKVHPVEIASGEPAPAPAAPPGREGFDDILSAQEILAARPRVPVSLLAWVATLITPWLLFAAALLWQRQRACRQLDPLQRRALAAARTFQRDLRQRPEEVTEALCAYLAARLRLPAAAAAVRPDLPRQLEAAGIRAELSTEAGAFTEQLVAARYGGPGPRDAGAGASALVRQLEKQFRLRDTSRP